MQQITSDFGTLGLLIDGKWTDSKSTDIHETHDPGTGKTIARVPFATRDEVKAAVDSSAASFVKWSNVPITDRIKYLFKMHETLEAHLDDLARLNTQNHGKTLQESRGDVRRAIENVEAAISVAYTLSKGETIGQISEGIDESSTKEPLGSFSIICPFNFPIMIPFWFIPYAIVLGDTVVVKPSEIDPVPTTETLKLIQQETRLPEGVLNIVQGGKEVVETLISDKSTQGVAFVGSTGVAKSIYRLAGEHGKRALVNGGAKNSIAVMPDAKTDSAVRAILSSAFGNSGQRCLAGSNIITTSDSHQKIVPRISDAAKKIRVGYGFESTTEMGPVVSLSAKERILGHIKRAEEDGMKIQVDGRTQSVPDYPKGYYLGPTIIDEVAPETLISKEEVFGPVLTVMSVESLTQAIEVINKSTDFGNMACIFTSDGSSAYAFKRYVNAGNIGVNIGVAAPSAFFPFGGRKQSFFGTLHAQMDSVDFFTDKKVVLERW
ncbi:MAG: CoA-acylating methylmalonate-semialdehyde dehydrogenase [Thaumarchaeota archaeon]|nr:CoA-acylating methylmalonate-semialdehyde dehydrogenase [Nitrososphaerota archaeon]